MSDIKADISTLVKQARESEHKKNCAKGLDVAHMAHKRIVPTTVGDITVLEYGFSSDTPEPFMIDFHGGGFIFNTADVDEQIILQMRRVVPHAKFISIDYPKAPEYPFPAAPDSIYETIRFYVEHAQDLGIDTEKMVIGGHSAGANLATVTCLRCQERREFFFKGQILDYPPLDLKTPAKEKPAPTGCIPPDLAELFNACYVGSYDAAFPEISPIFSKAENLHNMPPAFIITCGHDSLCEEGIQYASMLEKSGVSVSLHQYPDELHGFTYDNTPSAIEAINSMADFFKHCIQN